MEVPHTQSINCHSEWESENAKREGFFTELQVGWYAKQQDVDQHKKMLARQRLGIEAKLLSLALARSLLLGGTTTWSATTSAHATTTSTSSSTTTTTSTTASSTTEWVCRLAIVLLWSARGSRSTEFSITLWSRLASAWCTSSTWRTSPCYFTRSRIFIEYANIEFTTSFAAFVTSFAFCKKEKIRFSPILSNLLYEAEK